MFCANCGDKASKKYIFCMECGEVLEFTDVAQPENRLPINSPSDESGAKPFKLNPLVLVAAFLVIGVVVFAVASRGGSNVASPSSSGASQESSVDNNSVDNNSAGNEAEDPFSLCCSDSSNSSSNSADSGAISQPETSQGSQEQAPKNVKWVPTISAIRTCANDPSDRSCPGQSGVFWDTGNTLNVDGKALIQRLFDKGFCKYPESGPSGFDGEWKCQNDSEVFVVVTGNQNIVKILNVNAPYHWAAVDGALIYGTRLSNELLSVLGATFIKITT